MNNSNKYTLPCVTKSRSGPADFPLGSTESRAAARAEFERRQHIEIADQSVGTFTGLPSPRLRPPVVTTPDSVAYYQVKDGSIVEVIHRYWENEGRRGLTVYIHQVWPDGEVYRERGRYRVESPGQLHGLQQIPYEAAQMGGPHG
jgi:hypothetical protein